MFHEIIGFFIVIAIALSSCTSMVMSSCKSLCGSGKVEIYKDENTECSCYNKGEKKQ